MTYYCLIITFFITFVSSSVCFGGLTEEMDKTIAEVSRSTGLKNENMSIVFYDLNKKQTLYSKNADKLFKIASVSKLFVTGAAVNYLTQSYRFKTTVYSASIPDRDGIINSSVYIKGGGDPLFVSESMWLLVNYLVGKGIKKIKSDIYLDNSFFPDEEIYDDPDDRAYSARISSLSVNFNSIALHVSSGAGKNPLVYLDPPVPFINVENKLTARSGGTNVILSKYANNVTLSGNVYNKEYKTKIHYRNIDDPSIYFGETLKIHLQARGIVFEGKIKKAVTPQNLTVLAEVESRRLGDILSDMNRFSNNFIAEHVLRAIGAEVYGDPATADKGLNAIKTYLNGIGLKDTEFNMENGSGFSTKNKFTGNAIIKFLDYIYRDFESGPEFLNSLSVSGLDGTIRRSLKNMKGKIRAKTGTMSGVRSLAGYMDANGRVLAFVILANGGNAPQMINWEGKILAVCNGLH